MAVDFELEEENIAKKSGGFDLKRFFRKVVFNIHWLVISTLCGWYVSKLYLQYQIPIYQVSSSIYVGNGEFNENANSVLRAAGLIDNSNNNVNNQIFIFKSYNLIGKAVDSLLLTIELANNGLIKQQPVNLDAYPYLIDVKRRKEQDEVEYGFQIQGERYILTNKRKNEVVSGTLGKPAILSSGDTILIKDKDLLQQNNTNQSYLFHLHSRDAIINKYLSRLTVIPSKQASEMLELTLTDEYPDRAKHFLNTLLYFYDSSSIEYKNKAIQKALSFLNNRISDVNAEINTLEERIKQYKVKNKINDVSQAATQALNELNTLDGQKSILGFNEELLALVEKHIHSYDTRDEIVPNALSITDPILSTMVTTYNQLLLQKRQLKDIGTEKDPILHKVNGQLEELRTNILKNIKNILTQYKANKQFYVQQESKYSSKFNALPDVEKDMVQIDRQLNIKQTLYEYLLQKKEEVGVQLASGNVSNSRLVDTPRNKGLINPQPKSIYSTGIGIGLLIPVVVIFLIQFLNKKIQSRHDIEMVTDVPIIGEIDEVKNVGETGLLMNNKDTRSFVAEQYRSLRANLHYLGLGDRKKVILVTSFMRDEGKSFTSLNLADILAQTDKKVVILEFDLRKPKLSKQLGTPNVNGLSNFLTDKSVTFESLIKRVNGTEKKLDLINSGPIPPNPSELLLNERMEELFENLRSSYDFIILDTAPLGLTSDTFSIVKYADIVLYIVRHQFSIKQTLEYLNQLIIKKRLPATAVLINGIKSNKFDYGYGYGYGYSGTNGYGYNDPTQKKQGLLKSFFKKK